MYRRVLSLLVASACAVIVGAQPPAISPREREDLFRKNKAMIVCIVEQTVQASHDPASPLQRADTYYNVLLQFNAQIRDAKQAGDRDRVAELTKLVVQLLDDGLTPLLEQSKPAFAKATEFDRFESIRDNLLTQVHALATTLPDDGASKPALEAAKKRLHELTRTPK